MSVEMLLIPVAMAAYGAWVARADAAAQEGVAARTTCVVQTRLRDPNLLIDALTAVGATVTYSDAVVTGVLGGAGISFSPGADGVAVAHVTGASVAEAERLIHLVDGEYAACVQSRLYERLHERAAALGLTVESEAVGKDNSITVVLATQGT